MVPLADIFNHRSAIIQVTAGASIVGYPDLNGENDSKTKPTPRSSKRRKTDDNEDDGTSVQEFAINNTSWPLNIAICADDDPEHEQFPGCLDVIVQHPTKKHEEIWNTYGEHSNGALLMKYGFAEIENPHSIVNLDMDLIKDEFEKQGNKTALTRFQHLQESGIFPDEVFELGVGPLAIEFIFFVHYCVTTDLKSRRRYAGNLRSEALAINEERRTHLLACNETRRMLKAVLLQRLEPYFEEQSKGINSQTDEAKLLSQHQFHKQQRDRLISRRLRSSAHKFSLVLRVSEEEILLNGIRELNAIQST
eukprot:m.176873 g.176873  ORF g.176873 m.176873 type:complete len:307 (-) comp15448_c0_seq28:734-1654(-)